MTRLLLRAWAMCCLCGALVSLLMPADAATAARRRAHPSSRRSLSVHAKTRRRSKSKIAAAERLAGNPLVIASVQPLDEGQQESDAAVAQRFTPQASAVRLASQTAYAALTPEEAEKTDEEAFPHVIKERLAGPPPLEPGEKVRGYSSTTAQQLELPEGQGAVSNSLNPIALERSHGSYVPIDLSPAAAGAAFEPRTPLVPVTMPRLLASGVQIPSLGVSLTAVDEHGVALGGALGTIDGATVFYAGTQSSSDTLAKPTTFGFELDTMLRSPESPEVLYFKVGLPSGTSLVAASDGSGSAELVAGGQTVARIPAPSAVDAAGAAVPVSMRVSGPTLALAVKHHSQEFTYPIAVDPTIEDFLTRSKNNPSGWYFMTCEIKPGERCPAFTASSERPVSNEPWSEKIAGRHTASEWGGLFYTTKGQSEILRASSEGSWNDEGAGLQNYMVLDAPKPKERIESSKELPVKTQPREEGGTVCAPQGCTGPAVAENDENTAAYEQESTKEVNGVGWTNTVSNANVLITQEKGPEIKFNTSSPTLENEQTKEQVPNVLYGSSGWLGPHHGAFKVEAKDPGIGLAEYRVLGGGMFDYRTFINGSPPGCQGVECPSEENQVYVYNDKYNSEMYDGEDKLEALTRDPLPEKYSPPGENPVFIYPQIVKVDATPPHGIKVTGLLNGDELPLGESRLKIEATDGAEGIPSSGLQSITVKVDGNSVPGTAASCPLGPCTATSEVVLAARDFASGLHTLVVRATDNANNVYEEEFTFRVHGANPVSVGPGSVDPSTGQLTLSAADVTLGGGIGVSRTYESRELTAGSEGPLGPQWAINLGGDEKLTIQPSGNAMLSASGGANTAFARNEKGEFVAPTGDANLKLEAKEKEPGKGLSEYVLKDEKAGTTTKFEQPTGAQNAPPTPAGTFGAEEGGLRQPVSDAIDPSGDAWVTDYEDNAVEKFSPNGTLVAKYGVTGSSGGQFTGPWGIAVDPRNGNVYVSDQGDSRIEELSSAGAFVKTVGWGVSNGEAKLEICEKECKAGLPGSGAGQLNDVAGVTVDSSGNVWVADFGNNRVEEFNEKGEFLSKFGAAGKGPEQLEGPLNIALSGGSLYITDFRNNRIQEFSTSGTHIAAIGEAGSENRKFEGPWGIATDPHSGNLYVVDSGNARVQELTPSGAFITKFGSAGKEAGQFVTATGVAVGSSGSVFAVDNGANSISQWARATWVPTEVGGPLTGSATTYAYEAVEGEGGSVIEPTKALAPVPGGVSCSPTLKAGCRVLTFNYAKTTTATESEWGDYKGHLTRVYYTGWNPATGKMSEPITVAQYAYDAQGRLRAEWDPRISPPLKTIYGYDSEGHVTALTPPGQEPWVFTYGTITGSSSSGRLLKVMRPSAQTPLWKGESVQNTEAPKLSGSLVVGVTLGVSEGTWSGSPATVAYQWEDCDGQGANCTAIPGATNPNYKLTSEDVGHAVQARVTATNSGGSVAATTGATAVVGEGGYPVPGGAEPYAITSGPDGNLWFTNPGGHAIDKLTTSGAITQYALPAEQVPWGITTGPDGNLWFNAGGRQIGKITTSGTVTEYTLPSEGGYGIASGPDGNLWLTAYRANKIDKVTTSGSVTEYSRSGSGHPYGIAAGRDGNLWFTDPVAGKIGKITTSGEITEYTPRSGENVYWITAAPSGSTMWFTNPNAGKVGKIGPLGGITEYSVPGNPWAITAGPDGNLWFTEEESSKVGKITTSGEVTQYTVSPTHGTGGIAAGSDGKLWFADQTAKPQIATMGTAGYEEGQHYGPAPGTTIEYGVRASGAGAPYELGPNAETWAQHDDPVEGVALIPPDEPMGWPASSYKRATIHYWDAVGRMVNTALPTGGIATSEYNATNDVVRTLSADDRAAALKEGGKSRQLSELLDTKSVYNAAGTELLETRGPQHTVKLAEGGAEVLARNHAKYFYDENAPTGFEGEGLVTKTTDGAEYEGKEADVRTTTTSYGGQANLGWKLRKPTSVTVDPGGLNLTTTTVYDETTGNVLETTSPAGSTQNPIPSYAFTFGSLGKGEDQFEAPWGVAVNAKSGAVFVSDYAAGHVVEREASGKYRTIGEPGMLPAKGQLLHPEALAVDASGNLWVADGGNERVDEFTEKEGKWEYVREFGTKGTLVGQFAGPLEGIAVSGTHVWVSDTANNRVEQFSTEGLYQASFGTEGAENAQFRRPTGIAVSGTHIFIDDYGNHRVQEFTTARKYVAQFGTAGKGNGQLEAPVGIAADPKSGDLYVSDFGSEKIEEFSTTSGQFGKFVAWVGVPGSGNGQFKEPLGVATSAAGFLYVVDGGHARVEAWEPAYSGTHTARTIYYSLKANSAHPNCGKHAEWADLPCQTEPAAQPSSVGLPALPVSTVVYNIWSEVETTTETFGTTTRVKHQTYDAAGRALTSEVTSSAGKALPTASNRYNEATGALESQSSSEGSAGTITQQFNNLGQLEKYTDANNVTTSYAYDIDGRTQEVNYGKVDGEEAKQIYAYDPKTGLLTELYDTGAKATFKATYDVEGNLATETYPDGLTATYSRDPAGGTTKLEYVKATNCGASCTWFSDAIVPSIHGETLKQASTLAEEPNYTYDAVGRLTQVQEIPAGKGCTTRTYAYDEEANRANLVSSESATKECLASGGDTEVHAYDGASRLNDAGIAYDAFGNVITLPATDAGAHEPLKSTYYVDSQVASQEQESKMLSYNYDPSGRRRETLATGKPTVISHYAASGEALVWSTEGAERWTRNIPGIDGTLSAIQSSGAPLELQIHDLQGNIVATAGLSESETKLLSSYNSTEFGVPQSGSTAPKYAWLGAGGLSSELPSTGVVTTGASSYVPEIGRALQTGPIASPGAFPDGTGGAGVVQANYVEALNEQLKAIAVEHEAALEAAARREAEEKAYNENICNFVDVYPTCHIDGPGEGNCEVNCVVVRTADLEEEFDTCGDNACEARINGRLYFDWSRRIGPGEALSLAHGFELLAAGRQPGATAAIKGLPSAVFTAISEAFEAKLEGGLLGAAHHLQEAAGVVLAEQAMGDYASGIEIRANGYLHGIWHFHVIF